MTISSIEPFIQPVLESSVPYYKQLNPELKDLFSKRVRKFIKETDFEQRSDLVLTDEICIRIAACAIQLTMGFDVGFVLENVRRIIVYPDKFYSPFTKTYNTGEMNTAGMLVISWSDFKKGMEDTHDGYNVALHEMAHALQLEKLESNKAFHVLFDRIYICFKDYQKQPETRPALLREYAYQNLPEFFAVATESFFERPDEFEQQAPELFYWMAILLRQDPRRSDLLLDNIKRPAGKKIIPGMLIKELKPEWWVLALSLLLLGLCLIPLSRYQPSPALLTGFGMFILLVLYNFLRVFSGKTVLHSDRIEFKGLFSGTEIPNKDLVAMRIEEHSGGRGTNKTLAIYYIEHNKIEKMSDPITMSFSVKKYQPVFDYLFKNYRVICRDSYESLLAS